MEIKITDKDMEFLRRLPRNRSAAWKMAAARLAQS